MPSISAIKIAEMPAEDAIAAIRSGLAPKSIGPLAKYLTLTPDELARKLRIPARTIGARCSKFSRLSPESTEKLVRAARLYLLARKIFTNDVGVAEWLGSPAGSLSGGRPIDLLDTDIGGRAVEGLLYGIAYGNVI
jgi:putative toxin-antitoxin system antitoxin component (TIGR02293 family)